MRDLDTEIFVLKYVSFFICVFFFLAILDINFLYAAVALLIVAFAGAFDAIYRMKERIKKLDDKNED